jgi:hypothetical protein
MDPTSLMRLRGKPLGEAEETVAPEVSTVGEA